jgi:hypothetical protein
MKIKSAITCMAAILLIVTVCGNSPRVIQGTVSAIQAENQTLIVTDERAPNQNYTFSLSGTDMEGTPAVGDKVRVSYTEENGHLKAIRIMNLGKMQ